MNFTVDRSRSIITAMIHGRKVTALDVAWLRREVFAGGEVTRDTANELFEVERAAIAKSAEWTDLFVEMITDHVVWESRPTGLLSDAQAEWLIERCDSCASVNGLALLVNVLGEADRAPRWFLAAVRARATRGWTGVAEALQLAS
ncbi:MAG: hypothetical protein ACLPN5_03175 [Roseiarcus sp.]